jgi:uncharacterized protein YdhG (YjbR/CyaY superfamily)
MATAKPLTVETYIAGFPKDIQSMLKQLRTAIKKAAPDAEEIISYHMPLYKWHGMLVSFAAWKTHIGLYPTPKASDELKKQLVPYEGAKSTLRFPLDKPLPIELISKVVKLRMQENLARAKVKPVKKKA